VETALAPPRSIATSAIPSRVNALGTPERASAPSAAKATGGVSATKRAPSVPRVDPRPTAEHAPRAIETPAIAASAATPPAMVPPPHAAPAEETPRDTASRDALADRALAPRASLHDEAALLESVRASLAASSPSRALAALDLYDARFASGVLAQEAGVLRVEALLAGGDRIAAGRAAEAFARKYPTSSYVSRVRTLAGETP
jgi:hypothetical protein